MKFIEKLKIRKQLWKEYRICHKNVQRAFREFDKAEDAIFTSVTFETEVKEYDWPEDAPCKRKIYNDFNGPVDAENPPLPCNLFEYVDNCSNFPSCHNTECKHYANLWKYIDAKGKLNLAEQKLKKAKEALRAKIK